MGGKRVLTLHFCTLHTK